MSSLPSPFKSPTATDVDRKAPESYATGGMNLSGIEAGPGLTCALAANATAKMRARITPTTKIKDELRFVLRVIGRPPTEVRTQLRLGTGVRVHFLTSPVSSENHGRATDRGKDWPQEALSPRRTLVECAPVRRRNYNLFPCGASRVTGETTGMWIKPSRFRRFPRR